MELWQLQPELVEDFLVVESQPSLLLHGGLRTMFACLHDYMHTLVSSPTLKRIDDFDELPQASG